MLIQDVMNKTLVTIDGNESVLTACKIMGEKHIGCIVVTEEGEPTGVFTERDLLTKVIATGHDLASTPVGEYATKPLVTVGPQFSIREATRIMAEMKIKRLLVLEPDDGLVGIFTASDLAEVIAGSPLEF